MPEISIIIKDIEKTKASDSSLWLGTSIGIINLKYNKDNIFDIIIYDSLITSFKTNKINAISFDENNTGYFLTSKGVGVFNGIEWKFYSKFFDVLRNDFSSVALKGDTVYLGTRGEGVARIFKFLDGYSGASSYVSPWSLLPSDTITCILIDHKGDQWYGTTNGLVRHSSLEAKEGWDLSFIHKLPNRKITSLDEDKSGNIWIGTMGGLVLLETNTSKIRTWDRISGLPSDTINVIFVSKDQSVWIGTNFGISHFNGSVFSNIILSPYKKFLMQYRLDCVNAN